MTELTKVIVANGEEIFTNVTMVKCGCAVEGTTLDLCAEHKAMTEEEAVIAINGEYGIVSTTTETKEETTMPKATKVSFKDLKEQAVEMGIDIKGLRSAKAVQAAMDAFVPVQGELELDAPVTTEAPAKEVVAEPVTIDIDYTAAITDYATDLLKLVSSGTDYATLAKRVSVNAYSILGAQALSGVQLTVEQKQVMARHGIKGLGLDKLVTLTTVDELNTMSGTQLYIFATKIGAKPKLIDIEGLRKELIALHGKANKNNTASAASRANNVSTQYKHFTTARAVTIYPNAVTFIADNKEYTYIINPQGKGVLRHGNSSSFMKVTYLKGLLYNINTNASRKLVKALGTLRATKPQTQVGGAAPAAKEKNSTAKKEQATMTVRFNKEAYIIDTAWYQQFVSTCKNNGHKGSITAAMIVDAWTTRK